MLATVNTLPDAGSTEWNGWSLVPIVTATVAIGWRFRLIESLIFLTVDMPIQVIALLLINAYLVAIVL